MSASQAESVELSQTSAPVDSSAEGEPWDQDRWAENIMQQAPVTTALKELQDSIRAFELKAEQREVDELVRSREEFVTILRTTQQLQNNRQSSVSPDSSSFRTAWTKVKGSYNRFAETSFRFSKHLDGLMLAAPKYVQIAWGAIHLLLMAQVNDQKLKQCVPEYLTAISRKFELLESLTAYVPTKQMVDGLAEVYTSYLLFLRTAVLFYSESRLKRLANVFVKPWESRFQPDVDRIAQAIEHVNQIGQVIAFGTLQRLSSAVENLQHSFLNIRAIVLEEAKDNRDLLVRVEQILSERSKIFSDHSNIPPPTIANDDDSDSDAIPPSEAEQTPLVKASEFDFLDDLDAIRDSIFPQLMEVEDLVEEKHKTRERRKLSPAPKRERDLHEKIQSIIEWIESSESDLLWLDGRGFLDERLWDLGFINPVTADVLSTWPNSAILKYFCKGLGIPTRLNTPKTVVQTLFFQLLRQYKTTLAKHSKLLTKSRLQDAAATFDHAWQLFQECLDACSPSYLLIILGGVDYLSIEPTTDASHDPSDTHVLIERLGLLAKTPGRVIKVLVTADTNTTLRSGSENVALEGDTLLTRDSALEMSHHIPQNNLPRNTEKNLQIISGKCKRIKFEDIWLLYPPRSVIYTQQGNKWHAFIISELSGMEAFADGLSEGLRPLTIRCWGVRYVKGKLSRCQISFKIHQYFGIREISSLKYIPAAYLDSEADIRRELVERGKKYCHYSQGHHYREFLQVKLSMDHEEHQRVVVDFSNTPPELFVLPQFDENEQGEEDLIVASLTSFKPFIYVTCPASVPAYDLTRNEWSEYAIDDLRHVPYCGAGILSDINLPFGEIDVLWDAAKGYVRKENLFKVKRSYTESRYLNRKPGVLNLLHGPPASGMTFCVNVMAEVLRRPVLKVLGTLITEESGAESRFRRILRLATAWDAFVLMRDVDLVFQAYTENTANTSLAATASLVREELTYFPGLLYVITHRVATFDVSYHSLFAVVMRFPGWTPDARIETMKNLLEEVGYTEDAPDWDEVKDWIRQELCREEQLDGRRMRSLVHMAAMQARVDNHPITRKGLKNAARMTLNFTQQLVEQSLRQTQRRFEL